MIQEQRKELKKTRKQVSKVSKAKFHFARNRNEELIIHWMDLAFPRDINSILFDPSFETDKEFNGIDEESDGEQ